ncbi:hypothetical protein [Candidatus Nitrosotalea okcheonensis]|uniref:Uncharacterized protein n=1 Tax=Candidatus Nitrosotalea okcheonensis TaxID=1903276 RepID=A0A2H1FCL9_9ARCH|nr:hypothetical protein [Candidatus Nitrosotalea okcheonensis]MDE1831071.1 hypothetical protein [Nitrososphaerota archaeon]SMH70508.1 protein of unknown function [Candidatus Nitrosotalea okcheonensis]
MPNEIDATILENIVEKYHLDKKTMFLINRAWNRIDAIDESETFGYEPVEEFEKKLSHLNRIKEKTVEAFRPFADTYHTSLCAAMGIPMMRSIERSKKIGNYEVFHELFGLTNAKAKRFGLAALYSSIQGQKNKVHDTYNIVFDRDSPWTYRNEAEHMEEYARYHFNSYMINQVIDETSNPFVPVIELYEYGVADCIFMQTEQHGTIRERLATFHPVSIPKIGNVIAVHMTDDEKLVHYRRWGDPYFTINSIKGQTELRIIGIADQRFISD